MTGADTYVMEKCVSKVASAWCMNSSASIKYIEQSCSIEESEMVISEVILADVCGGEIGKQEKACIPSQTDDVTGTVTNVLEQCVSQVSNVWCSTSSAADSTVTSVQVETA